MNLMIYNIPVDYYQIVFCALGLENPFEQNLKDETTMKHLYLRFIKYKDVYSYEGWNPTKFNEHPVWTHYKFIKFDDWCNEMGIDDIDAYMNGIKLGLL